MDSAFSYSCAQGLNRNSMSKTGAGNVEVPEKPTSLPSAV